MPRCHPEIYFYGIIRKGRGGWERSSHPFRVLQVTILSNYQILVAGCSSPPDSTSVLVIIVHSPFILLPACGIRLDV